MAKKEVTYLQERNGIKYEVNSEVGFTGKFDQGNEKITFKNGKKEGLHTKYMGGNYEYKKSEVNWKDGNKVGLETHWEWWGSGYRWIRSVRNYKDGKKVGLWTERYENRKRKSEGNWKDGKKHGLWTKWYRNGDMWVFNFGLHTGCEEDGYGVEVDGEYKTYKSSIDKHYIKERNLYNIISHNNPDDYKKSEVNWKDGKKHGLWTIWFENGQKAREGNWTDDKRDGRWTNWDKEGNVTKTEAYIGGIKVTEEELAEREKDEALWTGLKILFYCVILISVYFFFFF